MGLQEPACGFLLPAQYESGTEVSVGKSTNLGVEAEVAFKMRTKLVGPGVTAATALFAVESAMPALELLDFMFLGERLRCQHRRPRHRAWVSRRAT